MVSMLGQALSWLAVAATTSTWVSGRGLPTLGVSSTGGNGRGRHRAAAARSRTTSSTGSSAFRLLGKGIALSAPRFD
jgi:hypothetical protein